MKQNKEMTEIADAQQDSFLNFCFCLHSTSPLDSIRILKAEARNILFRDKNVFRDGNIRYFQIKNLGLGVCEIKLRPIGKIGTVLVKTFENNS
jgi:hypothetical protein